MTISFIIPLFKGNKFLSKILENIETISKYIKNKENYNIELVLVNDDPSCTVDETEKATFTYIDNIIVHNNEKNVGIHASRIKGLDLSSGEYICFLDQDDHINETFGWEMILKALETNADVVLCNGIYRDNRKIYNNTDEIDTAISNKYFNSLTSIISPGQALIKRSVIPVEWKKNILKENYCDDAFLWCLLKNRDAKFEFVDEVLYFHNEDGKNQSFHWNSNVKALEELKTVVSTKKLLHKDNMTAFMPTISNEIAKQKYYARMEELLNYYRQNFEEFEFLLNQTCRDFLVVYGLGIIGKAFVDLVKQTDIKNIVAMDNNVKYYAGIKTYSLGEIDEFKKVVQVQKCCVCVTVGNGYEQIRESLLEQGFKKIYSLQEILISE